MVSYALPIPQASTALGRELRHLYGALCREVLAVEADTFQLMERVCSEVTLTALGTGDERYIFDEEEIRSFPHRFYDAAYARPVCPTYITDHWLSSLSMAYRP